MINSIQNGNQPLPVIAQVSLAGNAQNAPPTLKDPKFWTAEEKKTQKIDHLARSLLIQRLPKDIYSLIDSNETAQDLWDALERQESCNFKCGYKKENCELNYKFLNNLQQEWKQYATLMRQTKNLMDINIDALYNILKQNQGDVNDALGYKKKAVVITSDPLALVAEKTNVSKRKEKVVASLDYEGSGTDDFSELKKVIALLEKAFNRRKFYSKLTNNNLRTSSTSQYANKKQEFVKTDDKKVKKKADEKKRDMSKVKCYNFKKEGHFAEDCKKAKDQAWMEYSSDSDQEINANMVFMAQIKKVLLESDKSSSSTEETIAEVAYYTSESESESEFETSKYHDNSTNYGLFVNNDDDQEIFHDAIKSASENFIENHIDSQKDYDKSEVDHNDSEEKEHIVDKLIQKFNHKITKCQKRVEKANQQSKDFKNQNKDLQEKYAVLKNQVNTFEEKNNEFSEQIKVLNEKNADLLAQTKVLKDQLQVKHVVIDTHVECHEKYAKLKAERYEYMIRYTALFNDDKQHRKHIADQEVLFDKMSVQLVELDKHVRDLKNMILEKDFKISELKEYLDTFSSVRRPKNCGVIWKKKGSSNTFNVDLSADITYLALDNFVTRASKLPFEGLPKMKFEKDHLCSACEQGKIHRKHHKSKTAFASNKPLYLLHMDLCGPMCVQSINGKRYVLVVVDDYSRTPQQNGVVERRNRTLVEAARTMLTFTNLPSFLWVEAIATTCFTQNHSIIHKRFDKTPYELINKRKLNIKFFRVFGCRCYLLNDYEDVGKLKEKGDIGVFVRYSKESAAFRIYNKQTRKIHESVNVNFDEILDMASIQFSLEPGLSNLNETRKSSNPLVSQVCEASMKDLEDLFHNFYVEYFDSLKIMKSSTTNVETSINEEVFHEVFESFQGESFLSSLNDDVQQCPKEVILPQTNTQSISINMIPNGDEASTSHNVFNKRLEDAYFDDHPLHEIIGDPKSNVRTRGQLANSCLFSCLLSSIEPANVAEALRDANWDFTVFQMDVKTSFLNEILKEEVYVCQPLSFISKQYLDHVYALDKALYGLKQAPRAWYDVLS
nr:retrovirus-related Pol polyprotein from transposon TNT 1-94 [Tanacetum cinerariifolium]